MFQIQSFSKSLFFGKIGGGGGSPPGSAVPDTSITTQRRDLLNLYSVTSILRGPVK